MKTRAKIQDKRQVLDIVVKPYITEHDTMTLVCPKNGDSKQGAFPADVKAKIQYGYQLRAFVVALNTICAVSMDRIHEIIGSVFDIPLSPETIDNMVCQCAQKLTEAVETIHQKVVNTQSYTLAHRVSESMVKTFWDMTLPMQITPA